ncbi:TetR/AcrR family transcriptional regulator [Streptomyces sp. 35G-GA-8]|uniref:TetR/AcrR family transcriptional regulator n=1 Tax=Streptomyces sp. 35G-GA-8 TaxID=2939434 RepID=UPI00201EFCE4|nr:TetR/AcrR family transcriptional regulator [Streptomyces sp. 35G-GA-8]MCL7377054.1 TetR/AcrR family transcriptional regulator [Streptomyces sp. 35G-GA-8]
MPSKRSYASPLREQAAARTREQILQQATELFAERGYGLVTIADIASAAGVSAKTVFASVGSKGDILDRIVHEGVTTSGHEQAVAQLLDHRRPEAVLDILARGTRAGNEAHFLVHEAIRKALPVHENGETLWQRATSVYRDALTTAAHHLHTLTPSPCCTPQETADFLWFWFGPSTWRTLVVENVWSWDRAEAFLRRTATATLYGHP